MIQDKITIFFLFISLMDGTVVPGVAVAPVLVDVDVVLLGEGWAPKLAFGDICLGTALVLDILVDEGKDAVHPDGRLTGIGVNLWKNDEGTGYIKIYTVSNWLPLHHFFSVFFSFLHELYGYYGIRITWIKFVVCEVFIPHNYWQINLLFIFLVNKCKPKIIKRVLKFAQKPYLEDWITNIPDCQNFIIMVSWLQFTCVPKPWCPTKIMHAFLAHVY